MKTDQRPEGSSPKPETPGATRHCRRQEDAPHPPPKPPGAAAPMASQLEENPFLLSSAAQAGVLCFGSPRTLKEPPQEESPARRVRLRCETWSGYNLTQVT